MGRGSVGIFVNLDPKESEFSKGADGDCRLPKELPTDVPFNISPQVYVVQVLKFCLAEDDSPKRKVLGSGWFRRGKEGIVLVNVSLASRVRRG